MTGRQPKSKSAHKQGERPSSLMKGQEGTLLRDLEKELLSRELKSAKPVGLRYDRLVAEGIGLPGAMTTGAGSVAVGPLGSSYWYFLTNQLLISRILAPCRRALVACAETWPASLLCCQEIKTLPGASCGGARTASCGDGWFGSGAGPFNSGNAPLHSGGGAFDGILLDSSVLLSDDLVRRLRQFRAMLTPGGRVCVVAVNWEYEMGERNETYETSFRRYGGNIYLGLVKRTLLPATELEYISLLDPSCPLVRKLASMERDELKRLTIIDVPPLMGAIRSVEVIKILQFTSESLREASKSAGFSDTVVSGAPGILASRLFKGPLASSSGLFMEELCNDLAVSFPFVSSTDNPHIIAVSRP